MTIRTDAVTIDPAVIGSSEPVSRAGTAAAALAASTAASVAQRATVVRRMSPTLPAHARRVKQRSEEAGMTVAMATETTSKSKTEKDFVARLADAGEEALQRLSELPGGQKALTAYNDLRNRVDELGKKVRGIDELEARVAKLEKELAALKKSKAPARRQAPRKPAA